MGLGRIGHMGHIGPWDYRTIGPWDASTSSYCPMVLYVPYVLYVPVPLSYRPF